MKWRVLWALAAVVGVSAGPVQAAISPQLSNDGQSTKNSSGNSAADFVEAHQYQLEGAQVVGAHGRLSDRQSVSAWQVTRGTWNGQALDGLSLVLVQTTADDGSSPTTMNCYVSYLATPAQRTALLAAYMASQGIASSDPGSWRIEPAVIRFEFVGQHVVLHLGAIS